MNIHTVPIEADYVIAGAGAVGMAFADALLAESDASMIIVDRRPQPGGHWHDSYPFIRLHGASATYGVNSLALGSGALDLVGLNRGLQQLASGAEICAYFDRVMRERLLPSGRVTYLPMATLGEGGQVRSLLDGRRRLLRARRRWVDATVADTRVPATDAPHFGIAPGVRWTTPSGLARRSEPADGYVIVGAGKTAMDTALWLLEQGVDADAITWIRPRDAWLLNRAKLQPGDASFETTMDAVAAEMEAAAQAASVQDLFRRLEAAALLQRVDRGVSPTMFRCAIVSAAELEQLRRIERVVRMGRVTSIEKNRIVLQNGVVPTSPSALHVHCSSAGLPRAPAQDVFQRDRIVLQYVRRCAPSFSAALIARLEATLVDDAQKNAVCLPVAPPSEPLDWLRMHLRSATNQRRWAHVPGLREWLCRSRLDPLSSAIERALRRPQEPGATLIERYRQARQPGLTRLAQLLAAAGERGVDITENLPPRPRTAVAESIRPASASPSRPARARS